MVEKDRLFQIVLEYREKLHKKIRDREMEMEQDNTNHYLIYQVLGFTKEQGYQIDLQQNVGRFLYKYAGSMLEDLTIECLKQVYPNA